MPIRGRNVLGPDPTRPDAQPEGVLGDPGTMLHSISEPCINSAELYFCPNVTQNDASAYDLMIKNYWGHFLSKYLDFFTF